MLGRGSVSRSNTVRSRGTLIMQLCILVAAASEAVEITAVDDTVVPAGHTMVLTGAGFANATAVHFHWCALGKDALFEVVSDSTLNVVMPTTFVQDMRDYFVIVEAGQEATASFAQGFVPFTGNGTLPWDFPDTSNQVAVRAGAVLVTDIVMPLSLDTIYVETGGVLDLGQGFDGEIFAEDGAVIDFAGYDPMLSPGCFYLYHSPGTLFPNGMPTNGTPFFRSEIQCIPSLSPSIGIPRFYVGRNLNLTVNGPGTVQADPDRDYYPPYSYVDLTAVPDSNGVFQAWSGDVVSQDAAVRVRIERDDVNITASFSEGWQLEQLVTPGGHIQANPPRSAFVDGEEVTLTAVADPGHTFFAWGGDVTGQNSVATLTMNDHKRIVAVFRPDDYEALPRIDTVDSTVVLSGDTMVFTGEGFTNTTAVHLHWHSLGSDAAFEVLSDSTLEVTMPTFVQDMRGYFAIVEAEKGSAVSFSEGFVSFVGHGTLPWDFPSESNQVAVRAGAVLVTETTMPLVDTIYVEAGGVLDLGGGFDGDIFAEYGAVIDFAAYDPMFSPGVFQLYHSPHTLFPNGMPSNGVPGFSSTIRCIRSPSPSFGIPTFYIGRRVNVTVEGAGTVQRSPDRAYYRPYSDVDLTAVPGSNAVFQAWSGAVVSADPAIRLRVERDDVDITATFAEGWRLATLSTPGGSVDILPDKAWFEAGESVALTAQPDPGFHFALWGGDVTGTASSVAIDMDGHRRVVAVFRPDDFDGLPRLDAVDTSVAPVGDTITFTGEGFTNTTSVHFHWRSSETTASFSIVSNTVLDVVMPAFEREIRPHFVIVEAGDEATVGLPDGFVEFTGKGALPPALPPTSNRVTIEAGALLVTDPAMPFVDTLYVEAGGILDLAGGFDGSIFAEDGAVIDFTRYGDVTDRGVFQLYHSPATIFPAGTPTNAPLSTFAIRSMPSLLPSFGLPYLRIGHPLDVSVDGPGDVSKTPDQAFYGYGDDVTLTAHPHTNCYFVRWLGDARGRETDVGIRCRTDTAVTARFTSRPDYFRTWRNEHFTPEELGVPSVSGLDADPDGDGFTNAAEYAFGTNPRVANARNQISLHANAGTGGLSHYLQYARPVDTLDVAYRVGVSRNMVDWAYGYRIDEETYPREVGVEAIDESLERVTVLLYPPGASPKSSFARVHAALFD